MSMISVKCKKSLKIDIRRQASQETWPKAWCAGFSGSFIAQSCWKQNRKKSSSQSGKGCYIRPQQHEEEEEEGRRKRRKRKWHCLLKGPRRRQPIKTVTLTLVLEASATGQETEKRKWYPFRQARWKATADFHGTCLPVWLDTSRCVQLAATCSCAWDSHKGSQDKTVNRLKNSWAFCSVLVWGYIYI